MEPYTFNYQLDYTSNSVHMKVKGGPTQEEVIAVALQKMRLRSGDVVADIGCGSGAVAIEASKRCAKVYAIDMREEAFLATCTNAAAAGAGNIEALHMDAVEALQSIDRLDAAFVGGSKRLPELLDLLSSRVQGRIVVDAVLLRTLDEAVECMDRLGILHEVLQVQVSRSLPLAGSMMFKPIDPVFMIVGEVSSC